MNARCEKHGHRWRQKIWGVAGIDVCRRRSCDAKRLNPMMVPPTSW